LFIHPNEIISWKNLTNEPAGHYCLFKKRFIDNYPALKTMMGKYGLFADVSKSVICVPAAAVSSIDHLFIQMHNEELAGGVLVEDALQAYMQLIMVESTKVAAYPEPDAVTEEYRHIHEFFRLLEKETSNVDYTHPVRMRTAKEFAGKLALHPNHLNALLKKHTGQNVSTHIKNRLLEESKVLLLQTDWTLQDIGYAVGFAEQPNFSHFFKKNIGITPAEFRRSYNL
jgi:AraC-like DNA-binding protein